MLLYRWKTWRIQIQHKNRLQATEMGYSRRVEGVTKLDTQYKDSLLNTVTHRIDFELSSHEAEKGQLHRMLQVCRPSSGDKQFIS